jgi:plastocyanin
MHVTELRRTGKQELKKRNSIIAPVVWKIVILSIAIVIASFVIAGAIVATQVLSGNLNVGDLEGQGLGNSRQGPTPITGNGTVVRIIGDSRSNSYSPNPVEVKVGETVTWVNDDSTVHTATSNEGNFNSDVLFEGQLFSHTFDREGEYPYFCDIHPGMVGAVVVTERSPK